jgi:hypothetical protein
LNKGKEKAVKGNTFTSSKNRNCWLTYAYLLQDKFHRKQYAYTPETKTAQGNLSWIQADWGANLHSQVNEKF